MSNRNNLHPAVVRRKLHWSRTYAGECSRLLGRHQQAGLLQFLDVGRTPHALAEQGLGQQDLLVFACGFLLVRLLSFLRDMIDAININIKTNSVANDELTTKPSRTLMSGRSTKVGSRWEKVLPRLFSPSSPSEPSAVGAQCVSSFENTHWFKKNESESENEREGMRKSEKREFTFEDVLALGGGGRRGEHALRVVGAHENGLHPLAPLVGAPGGEVQHAGLGVRQLHREVEARPLQALLHLHLRTFQPQRIQRRHLLRSFGVS